MSGFVRRYSYYPGTETIALIEGVIIVDLPPPGSVQGVSTGVTGLVGEFTDVSSAVRVDSSGNVTTRCKPVEIFSGQAKPFRTLCSSRHEDRLEAHRP